MTIHRICKLCIRDCKQSDKIRLGFPGRAERCPVFTPKRTQPPSKPLFNPMPMNDEGGK